MYVDTQVRPQGEQQVGRLSKLIRECGYGNPMDYQDCVLGRAYTKLTGRNLLHDGWEFIDSEKAKMPFRYVELAAITLGIPYEVALQAERMCFREQHTAGEIADWLESQGL